MPVKGAYEIGKKITKFQLDLLTYTLAQMGSKVGLCELSEYYETTPNNIKANKGSKKIQGAKEKGQKQENSNSHSSQLKVQFLRQFSMYWIIHNVGQDIVISFEEFQRVIKNCAHSYNEKSEKLLRDFYNSANEIWQQYITDAEKQPTNLEIKHAILKIVARTLDRHIDFDENHLENAENNNLQKLKQDDNFGEQLYHLFAGYLEQNLHISEKPMVKMMKEKYEHSEQVKACKEYYSFFRLFIQEYFPHTSNASFSRFGARKSVKKLTSLMSKVYSAAFMVCLNRVENVLDLAFYFDDSVKENISSKLTFNFNDDTLDELEKKNSQILANEDGNCAGNSQGNSMLEEIEIDSSLGTQDSPLLTLSKQLTKKQKAILQQEQTIKNKIQIIGIKLFLIFQRAKSHYTQLNKQNLLQLLKNDNLSTVIFESHNLFVQFSFLFIQKVEVGFYVFLLQSKQITKHFILSLQELPQLLHSQINRFTRSVNERGLFNTILYKRSLQSLKDGKKLQQKQQQQKSMRERIQEFESTKKPLQL